MNFAQFIVKFLYTREIEFSHINHFNCIPWLSFCSLVSFQVMSKTRSEILRNQQSDNQYQITRSENPAKTRVGAMFSWQYREIPFHSSVIILTLVALTFTHVTYSKVVL